jgi:hypothetical protein
MIKKTEMRRPPARVCPTRLLAVLAAASITTTPVLAEEAKKGGMSEIERTIAVQRATQVAIWAVPAVATYGVVRSPRGQRGELDFNP